MTEGTMIDPDGEIKVSFGYQCNRTKCTSTSPIDGLPRRDGRKIQKNSSFSCLSGAALSANATLANTNICNGLIGAEILPSLDSPKSFRKVPSSPSLSRLDMLSTSLQSSMSNLSCSPSEYDSHPLASTSLPRGEGFLNAMEVQMAGGAAGEDRVQAVCSEENGWLFCAIYDGFNGRDAADFLAGTFYETLLFYFNLFDKETKEDDCKASRAVLDSLQRALAQAENDFLHMVEQEMEDRPDLVSVGSCVLVVLLHGHNLYTLNLGDSRAVLATCSEENHESRDMKLEAVQLTCSHTVENEAERTRLISAHPDDPMTISGGRVKGKLKVTRAFGVGYLKKQKQNDALMGILRVRNLRSPPYISTEPSLNVHRISKSDHFVIVASDGLFDFFSNEEAVNLVRTHILSNATADPAKFLLEQLVMRAADSAGFSMSELMNVPAGRRRKYHDDVTVMVVELGANQRTSKASTCN